MNNKPRILILEDTPTDAELTQRELRKAGISFTARCVKTKEDFLTELDDFEPDIILSDYGLPQFNGLEALRLVHELEIDAPFILITGSLPEEVAVECMKEGADDYILKTSLKRLPSAVLNALKKKEVERQRGTAVAALRRSEELYRLLAENTGDMICMLDVEGKFVYASPSSRDLLGYQPEELLGQPYSSLLHPDDKEAEAKRFSDSLKSKTGYMAEFRCQHRNGEWVIFETKSNWIFDWKGRPSRAVFVSRDISIRKRAEQELRESEGRYRELVENANDIIYIHDLTGRFTSLNRAGERISGYTREEALKINVYDIISPDYMNEARQKIAEKFRGGAMTDYELEIIAKDGSRKLLEINSRAYLRNGVIVGIQGIARDITERKQAEAKLRESEERNRLLVEGVTDHAIYMLDPDGRVASWNKGAERMKGYRAEEIIGKHFSCFYPAEDVEQGKPELALKVATKEDHYEEEGWRVRKDGTRFFAQVTITALIDEEGHLRGFSKVTRDITERKQVAKALEASEERYRRLVELSPETIAVHSEGRFVYVNAAGANLLGAASPEELVGLPILEIVHPDYHEEVMARVKQNYEGQQTPLTEQKIIRLDGEVMDIEVTGFPTTYQEKPAVQIIIRDITERKRAEDALRLSEEQLQQSQKLEAVGQLAGGVAHDFNNLLTVINGYSDLSMRRLAPDDPLRRNIEEIKKAGNSAAALTRQLLAFSRKQVLQPKVLELNTIVTDMDKMLRRLIGEDIELAAMLDPALGQVKADSGQVEQIIMNLIVNARDAMPKGGKLTIETSNVYLDEKYSRQHIAVHPGPFVMLAVSDTGCGMTAEVKKRIFEPFFTTKELGKGTGLGLSTVYGIVKQSGGNIWVYSEVGCGTTFKVYLPRVDEVAAERETGIAAMNAPEGWETILVVEDEQMVREFTCRVLREQGYNVLEASNGEEALQLAEEQTTGNIHLLLTDTVMPRVSGPELANRLKQLRPDVRVLFMSGYTDKSIVRHGVLEEGTQFIQKPFAFENLARKIREVLDAPGENPNGSVMHGGVEILNDYIT